MTCFLGWPLIEILSHAINAMRSKRCHVWVCEQKNSKRPHQTILRCTILIDRPLDTVANAANVCASIRSTYIFTFSAVCVQCKEKLFDLFATHENDFTKKMKFELHWICVQTANQRKEKQIEVKTLSTVDTVAEKFYLHCIVRKQAKQKRKLQCANYEVHEMYIH